MKSLKLRRFSADGVFMLADFLLSLASVLVFCLCAYQLGRVVTQPTLVVARSRFSRRALRLQRFYLTGAWALMCLVVFSYTLSAFLRVFSLV